MFARKNKATLYFSGKFYRNKNINHGWGTCYLCLSDRKQDATYNKNADLKDNIWQSIEKVGVAGLAANHWAEPGTVPLHPETYPESSVVQFHLFYVDVEALPLCSYSVRAQTPKPPECPIKTFSSIRFDLFHLQTFYIFRVVYSLGIRRVKALRPENQGTYTSLPS